MIAARRRRRARLERTCSPAAAPARRITKFDVDDLACQDRATSVPRGDGSDGHVQSGTGSGAQGTAQDRRFHPLRHRGGRRGAEGFRLEARRPRTSAAHRRDDRLRHRRPRRHRRQRDHPEGARPAPHQPVLHPGQLINLASGQVSIRYGFKGPNHAVVTACSTGAHAIGDAARLIMFGDADVMVAGGAEAAISRLGVAGFAACRALSTERNDDAGEAPRGPTTATATASCMGEGAGVVVLEEIRARQGARRQDLRRGRPATACPATPTTSPRPPRTATARSAA